MPDGPQPLDHAAPERHCLVAGGGIGGLSAALCLAKAGWRVTVLDRESVLQEVGAGLQISPNAAHVLRDLGLLEDLDDIAVEPLNLVIRRAGDGKSLTAAKLGDSAEKRFGAPFLVVHRGDLQHALLRRAQNHAQIEIILDRCLADIRITPEAITAITEDATGNQHRDAADLLVGADGLWSRARALAGLPSPSAPAGKTAWRTLIAREEAPLFAREPDVHLWLGPKAHLVHYPVRGGREINVVAIVDDDWHEEGWSAPGNPDVLAAHFSSWHHKARDLINAAQSWKRWALIDRAPEHRWSRERMTLLGDAAHPMLPFLAQGASQAIEDAAVLAKTLANAKPDTASIRTALSVYDRARISRTARIQRASRRQATIYHLDGPLAAIRDAALRLAPRDSLLERFAWIYEHRIDL